MAKRGAMYLITHIGICKTYALVRLNQPAGGSYRLESEEVMP